ncbi:hypothetical protein CKAH01_14229 [Colletotrichum kahawae]|uniref:DUF6546 domain-containing protein n=1 Tax=Colletotrichum kahawae TaxID=34407 RepID=A0AAD9YNJ9_COLKA|nr:hypothetical protein CKAH01_14229 [Colletotrichum kahawae]
MFFSSLCPGSVTTNLKPPFPRPEIAESTKNHEAKTSISPRDNNKNDEEGSKKKNRKNKKKKIKKRKTTSESEPSPPSRLAGFGVLGNCHRRRLLKNLTLEIMLRKYNCLVCGRPESDLEIENSNIRFTIVMKLLFHALKDWNDDIACDYRLSLEIRAGSPSDYHHSFPDVEHDAHYLRNDHIQQAGGMMASVMTNPAAAMCLFENPNGEKERVVGNLLDLVQMDMKLPKLPFIHQLVVNRSTTRTFTAKAIKKILKRLNGLERVIYEPMQAIGKDVKERQKANIALLRKLPPSIESLSLYEARSKYLEMRQMGVSIPTEGRVGKKVVAAAVAASLRCRNLRELSLSNAVDAEDFFARALEDPAVKDASGDALWPNLRRVALSTRYETRGNSKLSLYQLLRDAASVALRMPKLETMEIWAESETRRFLFRYHVEGDQAVISVEIDSGYYQDEVHLPCANLVKAVDKSLKMWRKVAGPRRQLSHTVERVEGQASYWDDSDDEDPNAIYDDEDQKTWPPAPSVCDSLRLSGLVRDASAKRRFVLKDWY